jgi:Zn ribbon nucleic-acid-binding protein
MSESTPNRCPECQASLKISVMRSSRSEDFLLECPACGYTAFASTDPSPALRQMMSELFSHVAQLHPFNLVKILRDPRHSTTDKLITLVAKIGSTILDHKTFLTLVAVFAALLGRKSLGILVASVVMICMVLHRDIVRKRIEEQASEELD